MPDVQFHLPDPDLEAFEWTHNEHFSGALATLELSLRALNPRIGDDGIANSIYVNGYSFGRVFPPSAMRVPDDDSVVASWRARHEPAIDDFCARVDVFEPAAVAPGSWDETLRQCDNDFWAIFGPVHRDTVGQVLGPSSRWVELYRERFGDDRREDALAMLAGYPNASTERAAALWRASRIAASDAAVLRDVRAGRLPRSGTASAREFLDAWQDVTAQFGCTTTMHLLDLPTWAEDPATPLSMIAAMAGESDGRDPHAVEATAAARRDELLAALRALDTGADEQVTELLKVYQVARHMTPASEDHNLICDQQLIAAARACWLRVGAWLVEHDRLAAAGDIFHVTLDEAVTALEGGAAPPQATIDERRNQITLWRGVSRPLPWVHIRLTSRSRAYFGASPHPPASMKAERASSPRCRKPAA